MSARCREDGGVAAATTTTKKIEITDGILPTDILLSVNLNYRRILPMDSQILITYEKIRR